MKKMSPFLGFALMVLLIGASASNYSGDKELIIRLTGEVMTLQKQVRDLQESIDKNSGQTTALLQRLADSHDTTIKALAQIEDTISKTQTLQANNLTGASTNINRLASQQATTDRKLEDLSVQINGLKSYLEQEAKIRQEQERKVETAPPSFDNPEQLYAIAYTQYTQGKYDEAINNFKRYVDAYPTTEAADNAQFWIAEGMFAQMRYEPALVEYDRLLTNYPNGDKINAALLKRGITLLYLERRDEGVATLRQVIANSPNSPEAFQAKQELSKLGEDPNLPASKTTKPRSRTGKF